MGQGRRTPGRLPCEGFQRGHPQVWGCVSRLAWCSPGGAGGAGQGKASFCLNCCPLWACIDGHVYDSFNLVLHLVKLETSVQIFAPNYIWMQQIWHCTTKWWYQFLIHPETLVLNPLIMCSNFSLSRGSICTFDYHQELLTYPTDKGT